VQLSVIIPVYNERGGVERLLNEVAQALRDFDKEHEVLVIDDGSGDGTYEALSGLCEGRPWLKVARLKRNFGQTAALAAGFALAKGEVIVTMDGDGQNDPRDIPLLLEPLAQGYDLAAGWRFPRRDPFFSRQLPSRLANGLISWLTGVRLHDYGCTLKAIRSEVARELRLYGEMHRFIPAIAYERGARIAEVKVNHRPRLWGKSKYTISRTPRVVLDLLTVKFLLNYATRPLHVFGLLGLASAAAGFFAGLYLTVQKLAYGSDIGGRPLLLLAVLLVLIGCQFITMGLIGEMLARVYHETQSRPIYVIQEIIGGGKRA
jgi:glycosyltransferase involved in cell wall biosynthesis